ncbi:hypothetical protein WG66_001940 [Moniliophthora roreri]|uniref:Uncharacterized protein n=1 Tax=Moniliophthora roreri TaxID=221103 RepID=A0A0W0FT08_MONRR|nr:hypothetical protein WG66_001940 [Moniliophthora roreri]
MTSTVSEKLATFLSIEQTIIRPVASLSAMYFAYGFYTLLFGTYICITRNLQQNDGKLNDSLYRSLTVTLFGLSTATVVAHTIDLVKGSVVRFNAIKTRDYTPVLEFVAHDLGRTVLESIELLLPVFLNITVQYMLIHRCCLIWGSKKRLVLPLIITSVLVNGARFIPFLLFTPTAYAIQVFGVIRSIMETIGVSDSAIQSNGNLFNVGNHIGVFYNVGSAVVNSVLTLLTTGRIWWIHRQVRIQRNHTSGTFIHSVAGIILESGIMYPISSIAGLIMTYSTAAAVLDLAPLMALSAGIAATLIMLRVKLGEDTETQRDYGGTPYVADHAIGNLSIVVAVDTEAGKELRVAFEEMNVV